MGASNILGNVAFLRALALLSGTVVFPTISAGSVALTAVLGWLLWGGRCPGRTLAGLVFAALALVAMNSRTIDGGSQVHESPYLRCGRATRDPAHQGTRRPSRPGPGGHQAAGRSAVRAPGHITDLAAVRAAMQGCDAVVHAVILDWPCCSARETLRSGCSRTA